MAFDISWLKDYFKKIIFLLLIFTSMAHAQNTAYIIVSALPQETIGLEKYAPVIHTGVGKVNASIKLYDAILKYRPQLVINYGTAGSITKQSGLVKVGTFVERDMDVRELGFPRGVVPFSNQKLPHKNGIVLATGDNFVTSEDKLKGLNIEVDLVDMEGFALKKVSHHLGVEFVSYKYISDNADEDGASDWQQGVKDGAKVFAEFLDKNYQKSSLLDPANSLIVQLDLLPHPEGGYFKETYRTKELIKKQSLPARFAGDRSFSTAIYYLLNKNDVSNFHKIKQDEVWHFYKGSSLSLHLIDASGYYSKIILGNQTVAQQMQFVVPKNTWMAAEVIDKKSYALVGATVAPGFDFADFTMAKKASLLAKFPQHKSIINRLAK